MIASRRTFHALGLMAGTALSSLALAAPLAQAASADPDTIVMTFVGDVGLNSSNATVDPKGVQRYGFQPWQIGRAHV